MLDSIIHMAENGWIPTSLMSAGIRSLVHDRYKEQKVEYDKEGHFDQIVHQLSQGALAESTSEANKQHYEVPAAFYDYALGPRKKYSCAYFENAQTDLASGETAMLEKYLEHMQIEDGMDILELGCGWGSLTLFLAERFPKSSIKGISNSASQKQYILDQAKSMNLNNVEIQTVDINHFDAGQSYDRIVSVEMFEHVRNYQTLFGNLHRWLKDEGKIFIHVFCHQKYAYLFETQGSDNWMGKYFFTGGVMPSKDLFDQFTKSLNIVSKEWVSGVHYQRTAKAWRKNMDRYKKEILRIFADVYGADHAKVWFYRWKIFFMSCEELFGFRNGSEWGVCLYTMEKD